MDDGAKAISSTIEARINRTWALKWLGIGGALFAFGAWCIVDAVYTYPRDIRHYDAYTALQEEGRMGQWTAYAEQWGLDPDAAPTERSESDIVTQWVMLAILWPLAFAAWGLVLAHMGRRVAADATHLHGPWGQRVPYEAIESINKDRWDTKGIALVHYRLEGKAAVVKIDDWVFRDADYVLEQVERRTGL